MYSYTVIHESWENEPFGKKFREKLPVFNEFPLDRISFVWKSQAERTIAAATVPWEKKNGNQYIKVTFECSADYYLNRNKKKVKYDFYDGKLLLSNGVLYGPIIKIKRCKP
jgi:hypothetical protein